MPPAQKDGNIVGDELRTVRIRELELKRITGEVSCAECRRLKLKCDRKIPCSSCTRRGCKHVCPTGTSIGNSGRNKLAAPIVVSDGVEVSRKLTAMSERIRVLEDALHIQNGDSHPLLKPELLAIKQGVDVVNRGAEENVVDEEENMVSLFGTLSMSEGKTVRFLGASAADNVLLMETAGQSRFMSSETLPPELVHASGMWPFAPLHLSRPEYITQVVSQLPPYERATSLIETYLANLVLFFAPIERSEIFDDLVPQFYPHRRPMPPVCMGPEKLHELALLFVIFSCGATGDLTQPPANPEAERYYQLSRASLGMRSILDFGSLAACQTLFLMGSYEGNTGRETSQECADRLISIGLAVAASIGLHLDPSRWKLETKLSNCRRRTFWEINAVDKWRSLGSGRPLAFSCDSVDCEFPLDSGATIGEDGRSIESVWQWRYRFTRDVLTILAGKICVARPLKYSEMMELDGLVRDFGVHPLVYDRSVKVHSFATDGNYQGLSPYITVWCKEMALLYIHRNYFARAMLEYPKDPLHSPFAQSVLAAYRSAVVMLDLLHRASKLLPIIMERLWGTWSTALSSAVIVGSVACRSTTPGITATALKELEKAIELFEAGQNNPVSQSGLILSKRLRGKAINKLRARSLENSPAPGADGGERDATRLQVFGQPGLSDEDADDIEYLNILRGTTRYVEQRSTPSSWSLRESRESRSLMDEVVVPNAHAHVHASRSNTFSASCPSASDSPSEVVQTPASDALNPLNPGTVGTADISKTNDSYHRSQDQRVRYDDYFSSFSETLRQISVPTTAQSNTAAQSSTTPSSHVGRQHHHPLYPDQAQASSSMIHCSIALEMQNQSSAGATVSGPNEATVSSFEWLPFGELQFPMPFGDTQDLPMNSLDPPFFGSEPTSVELNEISQDDCPSTSESWESFFAQFTSASSDDIEVDNWNVTELSS